MVDAAKSGFSTAGDDDAGMDRRTATPNCILCQIGLGRIMASEADDVEGNTDKVANWQIVLNNADNYAGDKSKWRITASTEVNKN